MDRPETTSTSCPILETVRQATLADGGVPLGQRTPNLRHRSRRGRPDHRRRQQRQRSASAARTPKKLATIRATAYRRDQPDIETMARAIVDHAIDIACKDMAA